MYSTVELFTTIAVLLSNREMWNVWIATISEGCEYAVLRRKAFVLHLSWYEVPAMFGVCDIINLQGTYQIDKL